MKAQLDPIPVVGREDAAAHSGDVATENIKALKMQFPSIVSDGKVDFDVLRQLLDDEIDDGDERYGLNWKGKKRARAFALTPSLGTLRPVTKSSVDWDTTQNIFIEGDNLEVLKLLRKSYAGRVKMIYIDPPYNTGNDFVYSDDYRDSIGNYERLTGQRDAEGVRMTSNKETSGRFHTDWLNMMYPRIMLAKELLANDGAIFVSIDESEVHNLRYVMDAAFGSANFVATLSILSNPKGRSQDKYFASNHDYVVVYGGSILPKGHFSIEKDADQVEQDYPEEDEGGKFRYLELRNTHREFGRFNRKDLYYPLYVLPDGSVSVDRIAGAESVLPNWDDGFEGCWTWGKDKARKDIDLLEGRDVRSRTKIFRKAYASGADRMLKTILVDRAFITERGQREFNALFGTKAKLFQSPKSPLLIGELLTTITSGDDIVLDFFAGSGTTGDAVMNVNGQDGGHRRFILVQLPEPLDRAQASQKAAADFCERIGKPLNIAEIAKERLRRAATRVKEDYGGEEIDTGFQVYELASSNLKPWQPDPENLEASLLDSVDNVLPGRTESDLLVELLLKTGIDLTLPSQERAIASKTVRALGNGVLMVCLADIKQADAEALGQGICDWREELDPPRATTFYFKDSGFENAATKANLAAIIKQRLGKEGVEKLASI